jgi:hypothetical protein
LTYLTDFRTVDDIAAATASLGTIDDLVADTAQRIWVWSYRLLNGHEVFEDKRLSEVLGLVWRHGARILTGSGCLKAVWNTEGRALVAQWENVWEVRIYPANGSWPLLMFLTYRHHCLHPLIDIVSYWKYYKQRRKAV